MRNWRTSANYANFTFVEDHGYNDDKVEKADACQAQNDPVNPGSEAEDAPNCEDDKKDGMFSPYITLDDASMFEAAEFHAIAHLAYTWDDDLDPGVSAQLVKQMYGLNFLSERRKVRAKVRTSFLFARHVCH